jgi:quercetin 2,3-dioxygenase
MKAGEIATYPLGTDRHGYLIAAKGAVEVNGIEIAERDGATIAGAEIVTVKALTDCEVVMVDAI